MTPKILVTGGRKFNDKALVHHTMSKVFQLSRTFNKTQPIIVHGDCPTGLDRLVRDFVCNYIHMGEDHQRAYPALWNLPDGSINLSAGTIRNIHMFDTEQPHLLLSYPGGRGTRHMTSYAKSKGCAIILVRNDNDFDNDINAFWESTYNGNQEPKCFGL